MSEQRGRPGDGGRVSGPVTTGEWQQWSAERREGMQPQWDNRQRIDRDMTALQNGRDHGPEAQARYQRLENDRDIADVDIRTTMPPQLTDSGQFEPGDLRGALRERAGAFGDPGAFDRMSPEDQRNYIRDNRAAYEQERAQESARRDGQRRLSGTAGVALGEVLAQSTVPWMGPSVRPNIGGPGCVACGGSAAPAPAAAPAAQPRPRQTTNARAIYGEQHAPSFARSETEPVYRGESRTPEQVRAAGGFAGHDPNAQVSLADHMRPGRPPGPWVSTSRDPDVAAGYSANPFPLGATRQQHSDADGTVFRVVQPGGVIVDRTTSMQTAVPQGGISNREVAYSQPVPWAHVESYARVTPAHRTAGAPTLRWVQNPDYIAPGARR